MDSEICRGLVINAPEVFADAAFQRWLTDGRPKFTICSGNFIDEWSDVIVLVDPSLTGEGSDSDMPSDIWASIVDECRKHLGPGRGSRAHYVVRLTNLDA